MHSNISNRGWRGIDSDSEYRCKLHSSSFKIPMEMKCKSTKAPWLKVGQGTGGGKVARKSRQISGGVERKKSGLYKTWPKGYKNEFSSTCVLTNLWWLENVAGYLDVLVISLCCTDTGQNLWRFQRHLVALFLRWLPSHYNQDIADISDKRDGT